MNISPDQNVFWKYGFVEINSTIVTTWALMFFLVLVSILITRKLNLGMERTRLQNVLEIIVTAILKQLREVGLKDPHKYIGFLGTLFLFVAIASVCTILPGYESPTSSLSTTAALAICVFIAVPIYGIGAKGFRGYLKSYIEPTAIMLPFNIIGEFSRTLAMAVRLFGNMMSGTMIVGILLTIVPLIFPIFMIILGLLTGMVQAYIFSLLATVYIAAAVQSKDTITDNKNNNNININREA